MSLLQRNNINLFTNILQFLSFKKIICFDLLTFAKRKFVGMCANIKLKILFNILFLHMYIHNWLLQPFSQDY